MKRCIYIAFMLALPIFSLAQNYNIQAKRGSFQPMSFDEYVAPLMMYKQHAEASENKFIEYINMGSDAYENRSYNTALMYYSRASELNKKFKFISQYDLDNMIMECNNQIAAQADENKFWNYINSSNDAYDRGDYRNALSYCQQASNLNKQHNYVSQVKLDDNIRIIKNQIAAQQSASISTPNSNSTQKTNNGPIYGQNEVTNPEYYNNNEKTVKITKVSITDNYTIVNMSWTNTDYDDGWCQIDRKTAIYALGQQYKIIKAENIAFAPEKTDVTYGKTLSFKLYFPRVPKEARYIDLVENNESSWKFYDIKIRQ